MDFLLDQDDANDDFMYSVQRDMDREAKKTEAKKLREGSIREFRMPKEPNGYNGTRVATIRFLIPFDAGLKLIRHKRYSATNKANSFTLVCPAEFCFDCQ